jgi:hypothetical protein
MQDCRTPKPADCFSSVLKGTGTLVSGSCCVLHRELCITEGVAIRTSPITYLHKPLPTSPPSFFGDTCNCYRTSPCTEQGDGVPRHLDIANCRSLPHALVARGAACLSSAGRSNCTSRFCWGEALSSPQTSKISHEMDEGSVLMRATGLSALAGRAGIHPWRG